MMATKATTCNVAATGLRASHGTDARSQSIIEDELKTSLNRPIASSLSSPSADPSAREYPPSEKRPPNGVTTKNSNKVSRQPPPPKKKEGSDPREDTVVGHTGPRPATQNSCDQQSCQQSRHHREKVLEALHEAAQRKQGTRRRRSMASSSGSVYSNSSHTSRANSKTKVRSLQKGGLRAESSNADAPNFDVIAFEQLGGSDDHFRAVLSNTILSQEKNRSSHETIPLSVKHKNGKSHIYDDDDASKKSQLSAATESSVFTNTCIKLKDYFPSALRSYKQRTKGNDQSKTNFSSSEGDLLGCSTTGRKNPRYRFSKQLAGSDSATVITAASSTNGSIRRRSLSSWDEGAKLVQSNMQILEEEPSGMNAPSVYPIAGNRVKVATKCSPQASSIKSNNNGATHVFNLPWVDNSSGGKVHGLYSGPVNDLLQPHGEGTLILEGNSFLKFYGNWVNGALVSSLRSEDEQRDQETYANAKECNRYPPNENRGMTRKEHKKKPSKEYKDESANQYKRESSKTYRKKSTRDYKKKPSKESRLGSSGSSASRDYVNDPLGSPPTKSQTTTSKRKQSHRRPPKQKYALGEVAHSPRDMIIYRSSEKGIQAASLMRKYEQAFLKRSNGLWTCAVLADRALQPTTSVGSRWYAKCEIDKETMELEESMLFVINEDGATKIVKRRHWGKFIRCMQKDGGDKEGDV